MFDNKAVVKWGNNESDYIRVNLRVTTMYVDDHWPLVILPFSSYLTTLGLCHAALECAHQNGVQ